MNKIIEQVLENEIPVTLRMNRITHKVEYIIEGFYKSDTVKLTEEADHLLAIARYDERTEIYSLYDLVKLNYRWWNFSKDRFNDWASPCVYWIPLWIKAGLIKENEKTKTFESIK